MPCKQAPITGIRFPWPVEEQPACLVRARSHGPKLANIFPGRARPAVTANMLTTDDARRTAANVATLSRSLLGKT
jgi:hypothetical protein